MLRYHKPSVHTRFGVRSSIAALVHGLLVWVQLHINMAKLVLGQELRYTELAWGICIVLLALDRGTLRVKPYFIFMCLSGPYIAAQVQFLALYTVWILVPPVKE